MQELKTLFEGVLANFIEKDRSATDAANDAVDNINEETHKDIINAYCEFLEKVNALNKEYNVVNNEGETSEEYNLKYESLILEFEYKKKKAEDLLWDNVYNNFEGLVEAKEKVFVLQAKIRDMEMPVCDEGANLRILSEVYSVNKEYENMFNEY